MRSAKTFDPYHKWLGIRPEEQPANHYRLLGVVLFEDDLDAIASAADQRMAHVRSFQTGVHAALVAKNPQRACRGPRVFVEPAEESGLRSGASSGDSTLNAAIDGAGVYRRDRRYSRVGAFVARSRSRRHSMPSSAPWVISTTGAGSGRGAYRGHRQRRAGSEEAGRGAGSHEASSVHFFQDRTQESEIGAQQGGTPAIPTSVRRPSRQKNQPIRCRTLKRQWRAKDRPTRNRACPRPSRPPMVPVARRMTKRPHRAKRDSRQQHSRRGVVAQARHEGRTARQHKSVAERATAFSDEAIANQDFAAGEQLQQLALAEAEKAGKVVKAKKMPARNRHRPRRRPCRKCGSTGFGLAHRSTTERRTLDIHRRPESGHFCQLSQLRNGNGDIPLLRAGYTHRKGEHRDVIQKGLKFLASSMIVSNNIGKLFEPGSRMYGQAICACSPL